MGKVTLGTAELYHADCMDLLEQMEVDAVVSDPPYGMNWDTDSTRFGGGNTRRSKGLKRKKVIGDNELFDPSPFLGYKHVVLFGSNHFAQRLPVGTTLVWIKRNTNAFGTFLSDAEIAWSKGGHGVYCKTALQQPIDSELHPTQKPVSIMEWVMAKAGIPKNAVVLDPYMGSGTTGIACHNTGRKFIGVEIDREYYETACQRIDFAKRQIRLFG